jgi:hypothetical protein
MERRARGIHEAIRGECALQSLRHKGDVQGPAHQGLREPGSIRDRRIIVVNGGHDVSF